MSMEGDELEMSRDDLQKWIRAKVEKSVLISPGLLEKCNMLQSLLERKEKQAAKLLKLWESVAACEATVKKQYSLLGWEYRDTDSDTEYDDDDDGDDDDDISCRHKPHSSYDPVQSETHCRLSPAANGHGNKIRKQFSGLRNPVVSLTRLPESMISTLRPPTPPDYDSDNEIVSISDSDSDQGKLEDGSSDSDFSILSFNSGTKKRRKTDQIPNEKLAKSHEMQQPTSKTDDVHNAVETEAPRGSKQSKAEHDGSESPPENNKALCKSTLRATKNFACVMEDEVTVNMNVLAPRRRLKWQRGKVEEILRNDGRFKYKIRFEDKRKILVSGHHIAFGHIPKIEQLFVGARVVVKCKGVGPLFCPGFIAELPSWKNCSRFLVFFDDHTPAYVGISYLHLVCQPLTVMDPLDDIADEFHRNFMKDYLKSWPYPRQAPYDRGQVINAEFNGVQQKCQVNQVDCSLIKVVFELMSCRTQKDQQSEWIYRGSTRLEDIIIMKERMRLEKLKGRKGRKARAAGVAENC